MKVVRGRGEHLARLVGQGGDQAWVVFQLNGPGDGHLLSVVFATQYKVSVLIRLEIS